MWEADLGNIRIITGWIAVFNVRAVTAGIFLNPVSSRYFANLLTYQATDLKSSSERHRTVRPELRTMNSPAVRRTASDICVPKLKE
jgi:hypothetical protein